MDYDFTIPQILEIGSLWKKRNRLSLLVQYGITLEQVPAILRSDKIKDRWTVITRDLQSLLDREIMEDW